MMFSRSFIAASVSCFSPLSVIVCVLSVFLSWLKCSRTLFLLSISLCVRPSFPITTPIFVVAMSIFLVLTLSGLGVFLVGVVVILGRVFSFSG